MGSQNAFASLADLDKQVNQSIKDGYLPSLPDGKLQANKITMHPQLRNVVVDRLVHLQYLNSRKVSNETLSLTIEKLQREARLKPDGWLGNKTWKAIQQIFTFEEPTHLQSWMDDDEPTEFILRATYLRLRSLGIIEAKRVIFAEYDINNEHLRRREEVDKGLMRFREMLLTVGKPPSLYPLGQGFRKPLMEALFDQDSLIKWVHDHRKKLRKQFAGMHLYENVQGESNEELNRHTLRFLAHLSKVELWLHGYHRGPEDDQDKVLIAPDDRKVTINRFLSRKRVANGPGHTRPRRVMDYQKITLGGLLGVARTFFQESNSTKNKVASLALSADDLKAGIFTGEVSNIHVIVDILVCAHAPMKTVNKEKRASALVVSLATNKSKISERHWKEAGFGNFLLDGIRRAWRMIKGAVRWFAGKIKKFKNKLSNALSRMVRFAKQLAFKGLVVFKRAKDAISNGMALLFNRVVPGSDTQIAMVRETDMDFFVLVDKDVDKEKVNGFLAALMEKIEGFQFAVVLFGVLLKVIRTITTLLVNPVYGGLSVISHLLTLDSFIDEDEALLLKQTLLSD